MNIKDMIKGSFMARPCMKMYNFSKNILVGIEWLWTRFFLALPSKHIRLVFLNCHRGFIFSVGGLFPGVFCGGVGGGGSWSLAKEALLE